MSGHLKVVYDSTHSLSSPIILSSMFRQEARRLGKYFAKHWYKEEEKHVDRGTDCCDVVAYCAKHTTTKQAHKEDTEIVFYHITTLDSNVDWLVVLGFNATLTAKVIIMAVDDTYVFPGFLTPVLTQLFFPLIPM